MERLLEHNFKTILDQLPDGDRYRMKGSGRLVHRDDVTWSAQDDSRDCDADLDYAATNNVNSGGARALTFAEAANNAHLRLQRLQQSNADIISVYETKLKNTDVLSMNGYSWFG